MSSAFSVNKVIASILFGLLILQSPLSLAKPSNQMPRQYRSLDWTYGEKGGKLVKLCDNLEINLPEGYAALDKAGTQRLNRLTQNPQTEECATIAPVNINWFAMFDFKEIGYVKDDEKLDPDELMKQMKAGEEASNEYREKRGWPPLYMVGWMEKPHYDQDLKQLAWATELESEGNKFANYETRILGRRGVAEVMMVASADELDKAVAEFKTLANELDYVDGERYAQFEPGDKMAEYGLIALITGGATVAAIQTGLLATLAAAFKSGGKAIFAGILAVIAAIGAFFKRLIGSLFGRGKTMDVYNESMNDPTGLDTENDLMNQPRNIDDENNQPPTL